jgi:hypothetical protein
MPGRKTRTKRFCSCIKKVEKLGKNSVPICVASILQRRGRTLKKFKCGKKPILITQPPLKKASA